MPYHLIWESSGFVSDLDLLTFDDRPKFSHWQTRAQNIFSMNLWELVKLSKKASSIVPHTKKMLSK